MCSISPKILPKLVSQITKIAKPANWQFARQRGDAALRSLRVLYPDDLNSTVRRARRLILIQQESLTLPNRPQALGTNPSSINEILFYDQRAFLRKPLIVFRAPDTVGMPFDVERLIE